MEKGKFIREAAEFAKKAHEGAYRKGTRIPYIVHPMEAALIVSAFTDEAELIAAAYLHDVIEDAGVTGGELKTRFGDRVAGYVLAVSEDKSKSWAERKTETVKALTDAPVQIKLLALGDKLSNMRSTARDYLMLGDALWGRFNEKDPGKHGWYYWNVTKILEGDFSPHPYVGELRMLCGRVFGAPDKQVRP